ncbi:MAG: tetratricopeptide repeat protein [Pseudomonadota bacterium]
MKKDAVLLNYCVAFGLFLSFILLFPNSLLADDFSNWYHGASGYDDAVQEAEDEEKPLIVYFRLESCKWCKKMNKEYLDSYEVYNFLNNIPKVEIEPDKGASEKALAEKYNVNGYPSFFISIPTEDSENTKIHPFKNNGDMTTYDFIDAIRKRIIYVYNNKGLSCYQNKQYEDAIKYFEISISFDPESAYAYYGKGMVHYADGYENKDSDLLEEAETDFLKALEIDPDNAQSKKELQKLQSAMEKIGIR